MHTPPKAPARPRPVQHESRARQHLPDTFEPASQQHEALASPPSVAPPQIMQAAERTGPNPPPVESQPAIPTRKAVSPPGSPTPTDAAAKPAPSAPPAFGAAYLHNPVPEYPPLARRMGEEGTVELRVMVSASGHVDTIRVERSSGYATLDKAAKKAVQQWTFTPGQAAGKSVPGWVIVPIRFSLAS